MPSPRGTHVDGPPTIIACCRESRLSINPTQGRAHGQVICPTCTSRHHHTGGQGSSTQMFGGTRLIYAHTSQSHS